MVRELTEEERFERGYRYHKALEATRRGYVFIKELILDFLDAKYWGIKRQDLPTLALELVDLLMSRGTLAVYQAGVNAENWEAQLEREEKRKQSEIDEGVRSRINEALDEQERQHKRRLAELEDRERHDRWLAGVREQLDREQREYDDRKKKEKG